MHILLSLLYFYSLVLSLSLSRARLEDGNLPQRSHHPLPKRDEPSTNSSSPRSIIQASSSKQCGDVGATINISSTSGPNGNIRWLNCGLSPDSPDSGWTPPPVSLDDIVIYTPGLDEAASDKASPFTQCKQYVAVFEAAGAMYNLSAFLLAAFALQESSCKADAVADAGTYGLMQLSRDKCVNVDCLDPKVNIKIGAALLRQLIDGNPNNFFAAIGGWNGWYPGMTYNDVMAHRSSCCYCQQNLDYLHQILNGWLQNRDAYATPRMGEFFNLDICAGADDSGFPRIVPGAAVPSSTFSFPKSMALLALVAVGILGFA